MYIYSSLPDKHSSFSRSQIIKLLLEHLSGGVNKALEMAESSMCVSVCVCVCVCVCYLMLHPFPPSSCLAGRH